MAHAAERMESAKVSLKKLQVLPVAMENKAIYVLTAAYPKAYYAVEATSASPVREPLQVMR